MGVSVEVINIGCSLPSVSLGGIEARLQRKLGVFMDQLMAKGSGKHRTYQA